MSSPLKTTIKTFHLPENSQDVSAFFEKLPLELRRMIYQEYTLLPQEVTAPEQQIGFPNFVLSCQRGFTEAHDVVFGLAQIVFRNVSDAAWSKLQGVREEDFGFDVFVLSLPKTGERVMLGGNFNPSLLRHISIEMRFRALKLFDLVDLGRNSSVRRNVPESDWMVSYLMKLFCGAGNVEQVVLHMQLDMVGGPYWYWGRDARPMNGVLRLVGSQVCYPLAFIKRLPKLKTLTVRGCYRSDLPPMLRVILPGVKVIRGFSAFDVHYRENKTFAIARRMEPEDVAEVDAREFESEDLEFLDYQYEQDDQDD